MLCQIRKLSNNIKIKNIFKNDVYDNNSINIQQNLNIGRDNKPVHSMEINGDLHITNTSDLINKDYKLNRLSCDK